MPYYVLCLRPVGNAVVPLSDEPPLGPLLGALIQVPGKSVNSFLWLAGLGATSETGEKGGTGETGEG